MKYSDDDDNDVGDDEKNPIDPYNLQWSSLLGFFFNSVRFGI